MYRTELVYFVIFTVIVLFSQFLPTWLLLSLDNFIIRILIVMLLLYLINVGPTAGIMGLVAISSIYLERNRRKVTVAAQKIDAMDFPKHATVKDAFKPQTTVHVNEFDKPNEKETDYMPHKASDEFEPVSYTINEKTALKSMYPLKNPDELYEKLGFGHINL